MQHFLHFSSSFSLPSAFRFLSPSPSARLYLSLSLSISRNVSQNGFVYLFFSRSFFCALVYRNGSKKLLKPRTGTPNWSPSTKPMEVPTNILVSCLFVNFPLSFFLFLSLSIFLCICINVTKH